MNNGWVKLHRQILENEMLAYDNNAYIVFTKLLVLVNRKTGSYTTGRFKLAALVNLNPSTTRDVLYRLKKAGLITQNGDNQKSTICICKWSQYQSGDDNQTTTRRQPDDTKQERRKKNNSINKLILVEMHSIYDLYVQLFNKNSNTYKLTTARQSKIKARLKDAGKEMLEKAITNVSESPWHMGDNDRGWKADLDYILRSYEQVEKLSELNATQNKSLRAEDYV